MFSLKARLGALMALIVLAAVSTMALISTWSTRVEIRRFLTMDAQEEKTLDAELDWLSERLQVVAVEQGAVELPTVLTSLASDRDFDHGFFIHTPAGEVLAWSDPRLADLLVEMASPGEPIRFERAGQSFELKVPGRDLLDADGELVGVVRPVPLDPFMLGSGSGEPSEAEERRSSSPVIAALDRWMMIGLVVVVLMSLGMVAATLHRVLGPVRQLTEAVQGLELGEPKTRVRVDGHDELAALGRAFNRMASRLEQSEDLRRQLVADVAHELRTPLTHLQCRLEAVQDGLQPLEPQTVDALHRETLHLGRLVDDLQTLALAEAGGATLDRGMANLHQELTTAARAWDPEDARIHVRGPRDVDVSIDILRFRQVIDNLLSNALRHGPDDEGVEIDFDRVTGEAGPHAEIRIRDHGPGVSAEHLPHLFDRFYRVDPARGRATGGTGLGLAIVKQWVELHGGTVTAGPTEPGPGLTVTIRLPMEE